MPFIFLLLLVSACVSPPPERIDWRHPEIAQSFPLKSGTAWVGSREWMREAYAGFAEAKRYVDAQTRQKPEGTQAVVLDLDQTVIDNIAYHRMQDRKGQAFDPASWRDWNEARQATLMPGALSFIRHAKAKGWHVVFVTNRRSYAEQATIDNLAALGIVHGRDYDLLYTQAWPDGESNKDARFLDAARVLTERAGQYIEIVLYVGDQTTDRPSDLQGAKFVCIPQGNLYGKPCEYE